MFFFSFSLLLLFYTASHRSSPSVDSADGMSVGGHSRQSSGSTDNYPTRSLVQRSTSVSVDPLQFVKPKENALAKQAEHQLKIATENREAKVPVSIENEEDWQSVNYICFFYYCIK